jgi:serine/threonine-protein kinase
VPSAAQARAAADLSTRSSVTAARPRPATGSHRPPPAPSRGTFSSGQRALLWAAGVLGALAIVIAILIVLNAQDRKDQEQTPQPTITDTITETTPFSPTAMPERPGQAGVGDGGAEFGVTRLNAIASPATVQVMPPLSEPQGTRSSSTPEQTLQ